MSDLGKAFARWRKLGATRIVLHPGGREVAVTTDARADAIADLGADAESVEAYSENSLVGVWRRPQVDPSTADPRDSMASMLAVQAAFLKEMMGLQVASLRGVREAMETAQAMRPAIPAMLRNDDGDDGQSDRDSALLAALMRPAMAAPESPIPPNGAGSK